jgi:hypothetical protein
MFWVNEGLYDDFEEYQEHEYFSIFDFSKKNCNKFFIADKSYSA